MKQVSLAIFLSLTISIAFSQTAGDYRTRNAGTWSDATRWEVFNAGVWVALENVSAGTYQNIIPTSTSGEITLRHSLALTGTVNINQMIVQSGAILTVSTGSTLRIVDDLAQTPLDIRPAGILIVNGTLDMQSMLTNTPCLISGIITNNGTILTTNPLLTMFNSGSTYQHANRSGGNIPRATWDLNSTCSIVGMANTNPAPPGNLNQEFGNFIWNTPTMGATTTFSLNGALRTINGNFSIVNTGREVKLDNGGPGTPLTVGGNMTVQGGTFTLAASQTSATTIIVGGNFNMTNGVLNLGLTNNSAIDIFINGNFQKTGGTLSRGTGSGLGTLRFDGPSQTFTSDGTISGLINYAVENGSNLDLGTSVLTGSGTFLLNGGGTIQVKSTDPGGAIQTGTSAGNIRVSGTRTYLAGGRIIYNGAAAQFIGLGHPEPVNTTIDNINNVSLLTDVVINGDLDQPEGGLLVGGNTLTLGGAYARSNGYIGVSALSNIVINGSGDFGEIELTSVEFAENPINNFTINRSAGTVQLTRSLAIAGTYTHSDGTLAFGQPIGHTLTLQGPFMQSGGALAMKENSELIIEGTGVLPAEANLSGSEGFTLTLNRVGSTFTIGSPAISLKNLNLLSGVLNNAPGSVTMETNALVTRHSTSSVTNSFEAITNYDVTYNVTTDIVAGNELPTDATKLGNLTKLGTGGLDLNGTLTVNGTLLISQGVLNVGANHNTAISGDLIVQGNLLTESTFTFFGNGAQGISGLNAVIFPDIVIDQPSPTSLTLSIPATITNGITVNSATVLNAGTNIMTLASNATRTAFISSLPNGASVEGSVIVQRYLPNAAGVRTWRYVAAPVTGSFVSDWKTELTITGTFSDPATGPGVISGNPSMYIYDETFVAGGPTLEDRYRPYPTSGPSSAAPLQNGVGYAVFGRTYGNISFDSRGRIGQGPVSRPVTNSGGTNSGWNLIGNPYPCPLDWDAVAASFQNADINNAVYMTDGTYNSGLYEVSYVDGVGVPASFQGIIAPSQCFYVFANVNSTFTLNESHKVGVQTQFFRKGEIPNLLRISVKNDKSSDEVALRLHENASDLFDPKYDAIKFFNTSPSLSFISADEKNLTINSLSSLCEKIIPLHIEKAEKGSYAFDFSGIKSFESGTTLILKDKVLGKIIDLTTVEQYGFVVDDTLALRNRFEIILNGSPVQITSLDGGFTCGPGAVSLKANAEQATRFNWYENEMDVSPLPSNGKSVFVTPLLTKSKTYFVAPINALGCEGKRFPVEAKVIAPEPATIEQDGYILISNYSEGVQWFLDGLPLRDGKSQKIETTTSGMYSIEVTNNGCKLIGLKEISFASNILSEDMKDGTDVIVYPNPTSDKFTVALKSDAKSSSAKLVSPLGIELAALNLIQSDGIHSGELDLKNQPDGIYIMYVLDGQNTYVRKIIKGR
jgi:hypothetical protein